jgi:hypothetical protein
VTLKERAERAARFAVRNLDALFIIALAAVVFVLEIRGNPDREVIDATLLALLGVMAFVLLRDRHDRRRIDEIVSFVEEVRGNRSRVAEIAAFVEDLRSDRPYQVHSDVNSWVIDEGGRRATFTKTQGLVFTRNKVCTMEHWCTGTVGTVKKCRAEWRLRDGEQWEPVDSIHDFGIDSGRKYIFCLDTERSRGDGLHWRVSRELHDRFPNQRETVSLRLQTPTHRPRMRVVWPLDREPRVVEMLHDGASATQLTPLRNEEGRLYVDEQLPSGADSLVKIEWTW